MLGFAKLDGRIAPALVRVDEVGRVELVAAVVALVATRIGIAADRALAFDVAVRQCTAACRVEGAHLLVRDQVALLIELEKQVLGDAVVVGGRRPRKDVVRHAQAHKVLDDQRVVPIDELAGRDALLVRFIRDGGSVLVGAACHQHARAAQPLETGEHVRGHGETDHVADMSRAVGVRPRRRYEHSPWSPLFRNRRSQG